MSNRRANALSDATSSVYETLESRVLLCDPHMLANLPEPPQWSEAIEAQARAEQLQEGGPDATVINWTNRNQASDGFNVTFGTRAEQMRGIVDAALLAWQQVITNWNRADGSITLQVSINVGAPGSGFGGSAGPSSSAPSDGKPRTGSMSLGGGSNTADPNDTNNWFADPSPFDNAEFLGEITNAYVGRNNATGGNDFFSLVTIEMAHVLGLISDRNNGGGGFNGYRLENFVTNAGITDAEHGRGQYFAFDGATVDHLMTGFNGGDLGPLSWGNVVHTANAPANIDFAGRNWRGSEDVGNGSGDLVERHLPSFVMAHILRDAYGYSIAEPQTFGTMYAILNETSGRLTIRGATGSTVSADVITVSFVNGNTIRVSVNIGNDIPGTGAQPGVGSLPPFVTDFLAIGVTEIRIDAGDGNDTVNIESLPSFADATVIGGLGDDVISFAPSFSNLDTVDAPVLVDGGAGADIVLFEDDGSTYAGAYTINTVFGFGSIGFVRTGTGAITLTNTTTHTINGAGGGNAFNLNSAFSGTTWTLNGFNGDDVFNIGAVGGNAESVDGAVAINGMVGTDTFNYNDSTATGTPTYALTTTQLTRTGNGTVTYGTIESIRIDAGAGNNLLTYPNPTTSTTPPVVLSGNGGDDTFQLDYPQQAPTSGPATTVTGGPGADTLVINDALNNGGFLDFNTINAASLNIVAGNNVNHDTLESVVWNSMSAESKAFFVMSTAASTALTINGSNNTESFLVGGSFALFSPTTLDSLLGPITLNGNGGTDNVSFNDHETSAANTYTLNASAFTRTGVAQINYAAGENVTINSGNFADTINVLDHPAGVAVTVDGRAGLDTVNINSDNTGVATARFAATQDLAALNIGAGGTAVLTAGGNKVIDTDALTVAATGKLDLGDGALIVDYAGASPLSSIRAALGTGYNGGAWNGNGINSSVAATNTTHALGYAESAAIFSAFPAAFAGREVDNTAVVARYTRYGDADLNLTVSLADFSRLAGSFGATNSLWTQGNFNFDNTTNLSDFTLLAANFGLSAAPATAASPTKRGDDLRELLNELT